MSKQTSIEWLIQQFKNKGYIGLQDELQAKQMHKEEIIEAFIGHDSDTEENIDVAEEYYQEIYERKTI